jgi:hypothetical protein
MTEIKLIFRFNISEIVYPTVQQLIKCKKQLNLISYDKIKDELLNNKDSEKINKFINNGELIPAKYWCPFLISMVKEGMLNVFTAGIGNIEMFKEFETFSENKNYKITELKYLKVNDIPKLFDVAKEKYFKIYDDYERFNKDVLNYQNSREDFLRQVDKKYKSTIIDFFTEEITI